MNVRRAAGWGAFLGVAAGAVFVGVAAVEVAYVLNHPHAYGPALVIACGAGGGLLVAAAMVLACMALFERAVVPVQAVEDFRDEEIQF
jgi:hypothetical protein